jgi:hypothetical protein
MTQRPTIDLADIVDPREDHYEAIASAADSVTMALNAEIEARCAWAFAFGYDLAVSSPDIDETGEVRVWYVPIEPGEEFVPSLMAAGSGWTRHYCGRVER